MKNQKAVCNLLAGLTLSFLSGTLLAGCSQSEPDPGNAGGTAGTGVGTGGTAPAGGKSGTGGSTSTGGAGGTGASAGTPGGSGSGVGGSVSAGGAGGAPTTGGAAGTGTAQGGAAAGGGAGAGGTGTAGGPPNGGTGNGGMSGQAGGPPAGGNGGSAGQSSCPTVSDFDTWPDAKGPLDIGKLAVTDFKTHTGDEYGGAGYALAISWYGGLLFTKTTGDTQNNAALITAFEPYATGSKTVDNSASATVDSRVFGVLPLEVYIENQDARCKTLGLARADQQWVSTTSDGITKDARYWIDDMYMITGLQVMAYRATGDKKYLDRAALTMKAYITALQQSDGLFWHTKDSHAYWGRANGWVASGMTELLLELPNGADRTTIMAAYKKQIDALLGVQVTGGSDDGAWKQVLDISSNTEMSCTAMFTYALIHGVKNGWLTDPKYAAAAKRGWAALAANTSGSGKLAKICPGTGAAPSGSLSSQQQFYAGITLGTGDLHGQAPLIWAANALLRKDCPGVR